MNTRALMMAAVALALAVAAAEPAGAQTSPAAVA